MRLQSVGMMRNITTFHNLATQAVERTASGGSEGKKITFNIIKQRLGNLMYKVTSQKFEDPADGEEAIRWAMLVWPVGCKISPLARDCSSGFGGREVGFSVLVRRLVW